MALSINPVAVWELNETSGTSLADATGNGYAMTTHASPTLGATGKVGNAMTLASASSQYADLAHNAAFNSASYSVCAWIKRAGTPTEEYVLTHDGTASNTGWAFGLYQNKIMCLHQSIALVQSTSTITDTNWHHVGYTYDGTNAKFYLDGALDRTVAAGAFTAATQTEVIGANKDTSGNPKAYFNGTLDQIAYFGGVLVAADFTTVYNSGNGLAYPWSSFIASKPFIARQAVNRASTY